MNAFIAVLFVVASASAGNIAYGGLGYSGVSYAAPALSYAPAATYSNYGARVSQSVRAVAAPVAYAQPAVSYAPSVAYAQPAVAYAHAPVVTKAIAPVAQSTAFVNRAPAARLAVAAPVAAYAHAPVATYAHAPVATYAHAPVATYAHAPAVAAPLGVSYGSVGALGVSSLGYGSAYLH